MCPDTREQLAALAIEGAGSKLRWVEKDFDNEGAQRGYIYELEPDADVIIVVDADEIYGDNLVQNILSWGGSWNGVPVMRGFRLPFWHYWRSFKRGFMHDPAWPERVIFPKNDTRLGMATPSQDIGVIHHFGYAQRSEIVQYKQLTHGHKGEWRKDVDWFTDVFMANRQYDCHPVGSDAWNCEDMDASVLPRVLNDHPFRLMEVIL